MGRAPCCDKVGLKRGPWTLEEDHILISFVRRHGHSNWRALPKQAGLLRCGKSCRLRWINYLKPDIKRGNFTKEEDETIIKLHEIMGNRWSAIAARLPGRTDNEIKNVWHTHLKKKLTKYQKTKTQNKDAKHKHCKDKNNVATTTTTSTKSILSNNFVETSDDKPSSSQQSYSSNELSSMSTKVSSMEFPYNTNNNVMAISKDEQNFCTQLSDLDDLSMIDHTTFWSSRELSIEDYDVSSEMQNTIDDNQTMQSSINEEDTWNPHSSDLCIDNSRVNYGDNSNFWFNVFLRASEVPELPQF